MATPRQVVEQAMALEVPERQPACIYGGGMWTLRQAGETFAGLSEDPARMSEVIARVARDVGSDIVYTGSGYNNVHVAALGGRIKYRQIGAPDLEEPLVGSIEDLAGLKLERVDEYVTVRTVQETARRVAAQIGQEYMVTMTSWGPFSLGAQILGVEQTMRGCFRQPELVRAVVDFAAEFIRVFYAPVVEDGTLKLVSLADPTAAGSLISKKHYAQFALPPLQRLAEYFRSRGAATLLHICGDTQDRLELLTESGAQIVSIDTAVELAAAKAAFTGKTCLGGNLDPVHVLQQGTPEEVVRGARRCLDDAAAGGGFILMPGCDTPPLTPRENVDAFLHTAFEYRLQG
jgi:uroporphyrinogen decarboxylase